MVDNIIATSIGTFLGFFLGIIGEEIRKKRENHNNFINHLKEYQQGTIKLITLKLLILTLSKKYKRKYKSIIELDDNNPDDVSNFFDSFFNKEFDNESD